MATKKQKSVTMWAVNNGDGDILLFKKQPHQEKSEYGETYWVGPDTNNADDRYSEMGICAPYRRALGIALPPKNKALRVTFTAKVAK